ncbi:8649_t:CDS:2 [Funneliformis geosporum]|nr:8649_t:CDS:2 [Funneliformis geosporum]
MCEWEQNLGFDHPICSGVLDVKSEPFINILGSFCNIFKELFQKYKLKQNHNILDTCEKFIQNEELKINEDEDLRDVEFGKWLDSSERL